MKPPIIADSSGLVSLISEDDSNHKIAIAVSEELIAISSTILISSDVFSETLNVIGKKFSHNLATKVGKEIVQSNAYAIIETDAGIRENALKLFYSQPQSVSFTDCVVMALADQYSTKDILGFDEVFRKNGYNRLGLDKH